MPDAPLPELDRVLAEQRRCAEEFRTGPDPEGAWNGLTDWQMEEVLIRLEEK